MIPYNPNINALSRRKLFDSRKQQRETTAKDRALFESCLDKVSSGSLKDELDELVRSLQSEGERLARFRSMAQLDYYKKKVKDFLSRANRGTFKVKTSSFIDSHGDFNSHVLVEKVDSALDELTRIVLSKEGTTLQVMEKLDLIKGLLTDIYQ